MIINQLTDVVIERRKSVRRMRRILLLIGIFLILIPLCSTQCPFVGAEWNPTGNPIGGGPGYSDSIRHQDADFIVHNANQLLSALSSAGSGNIIYIWDTCHVNMNGHTPILIPAGVTVASGRGRTLNDTVSWGALIYYDDVGANQWEMFRFLDTGKSRVTGLRFRGSYSCLEGRQGGVSFEMPVAAEAAICVNKDSCEIDNCEFWGFGYAGVFVNDGVGSRLHHSYFHDGNHVYHGYAVVVGGTGERFLIEANYFDYHLSYILGGSGATSLNSSYEACWNITGEHADHHSLDRHGGVNDSCAADYMHHNTIRFNGYSSTGASGVGIDGNPIDSVFIHDNWFWDDDSVTAIKISPSGAFRIWGNRFTDVPPSGLLGRLPVANITADIDSGTAPLTVTFKAFGSYDPDGELRAFYWNFGDSSGIDNYARYTDVHDSVQHTFHEIGIYRVELMVTDDAGIPAAAYKDINVAPTDGRNWLSAWVKDRYHGDRAGYYSVQILIDNWLAWERDIKGDSDWEHVIVDVTDSLAGKDSATVAFRLFCEKDSSEFGTVGLMTFWDDVVLYGTNVVNGDFESGRWAGTAEQSDGNWIASRSTYYYCWDYRAIVHSGINSYFLGRLYSNVANEGDYCQVEQRISIGPPSFSGQGGDSISFHVNPSLTLNKAMVTYEMPVQSDVSLRVYDINGRLVKKLRDDRQEAGSYQIDWQGKDEHGRNVANGVYLCKFIARPVEGGKTFTETRKLVFLH